MNDSLTIRRASARDADAVRRLAALDDRAAPDGAVLLRLAGDELVAALSMENGHAVADPFRPTAPVLEILRVAAAA